MANYAPPIDETGNPLIPEDILAVLTPDQQTRLSHTLDASQRQTAHKIKYKASTSLFGRRFYLAFFAGSEQRSEQRLGEEGQKASFLMVTFHLLVVALIMVSAFFIGLGLAVIAAYIFKSALGIDFFEGPSIFHSLLY